MQFFFSFIGLFLGLSGSILLAHSLRKIIQELIIAFQFHDTTIQEYFRGGHVPVFTGIEKRLNRGFTSGKRRTITGVILLAFGFACQLVSLLSEIF